jgi:hypothetical protein
VHVAERRVLSRDIWSVSDDGVRQNFNQLVTGT